MRGLIPAALALTLAAPAVAPDTERWEIVESSEKRFWRLDWKTGRILTCTLPCENSLRVTLSEAISAPQRRSKKLSAQRTANEQDNKEYQLASLNKMSAMSRKPVRSAVSNAGNGAR